jgi:uncharacterized protein DUF6644
MRSEEILNTMSLLPLCEWLASTRGSTALHQSVYMYPVVESVHVWALTVFVGFATILDLRLLGLAMREVPVSRVIGRLLPWTTAGFVVMVASGALLFYAIPVRSYQSVWFRGKVVMLLLAGLNAWIFHSRSYPTVATWGIHPDPPRRAKMAGALSLVLWGGIIIAGRMIAYNWFDCNQPQSPIVTWAAGCTPGAP